MEACLNFNSQICTTKEQSQRLLVLGLKPEDVELIPDVKEDNFSNTDWNQVRVQASIGAMQVILGRNNYDTYKNIAADAVGYADALIKELKK